MSSHAFAKTYEDIHAHVRTLLGRLEEDEDYTALVDRARSMGITLTVTYHHTHSQEYMSRFIPVSDAEGALPGGYELELWFDLNRGDRILSFRDEDGNEVQCSYTMTAATSQSYLLFSRVVLYSYEEMMAQNQLIAALTDYLDASEEYGLENSPFLRDSLTPTEPRGEEQLLRGKSEVGEGAYVEIVSGDDDGTFGHDDACYFSEDAFWPYRLILLSCVGAERINDGASLTLTPEEAGDFLTALDDLPDALSGVCTFADALSDTYQLSAFAPPPRLETCLNRLTLLRREEFLSDAVALREYLTPEDGPLTPITFIW